MALIEASTSIALFRGDEFLRIHDPETGVRTKYAPLYDNLQGLDSMLEDDDFGRLKDLVNFISDSGKFVLSLTKPWSALGAAYDAYNDFNHFLNTFDGQKDLSSNVVYVTYPNNDFDALVIYFSAWSKDDNIDDFIANPTSTTSSITRSAVNKQRDHPHVIGGPEYANVWDINYRIGLDELAQAQGDEMYNSGIPFTFSFQVAGRLSLQHIVVLKFCPPPAAKFHPFPEFRGMVGSTLTLEGENLYWVREVTFNRDRPVPINFAYAPGGVIRITVPGDANHTQFEPESAVLLLRSIGGGIEHCWLTVDYPFPAPTNLVLPQEPVRYGDIIPIEGVDLRFIEEVSFAAGNPEQRFPTTWRDPGEKVSVDEFHWRWKIYVSVPNGLPELVHLIVKTQGGEIRSAPIAISLSPAIENAYEIIKAGASVYEKKEILVRGKNLNYSPTVLFGGQQARITSSWMNSLKIEPPANIPRGRVQITTQYGNAVSEELILSSAPPPPPC